jgi:transcriptional regulator with XRE-family HTH domain
MQKKTLNQQLAENLAALMSERKLSANQLGKKAGLSPRTLANYLKTDHNPTDKGKERSAKLTEVEKLAEALNVPSVLLLTEFQKEVLSDLQKRVLSEPGRRFVIHAAPGTGKTATAMKLIEKYLTAGETVIVLSDMIRPHSATRRDIVGNLLHRLANNPDDAEVVKEIETLIEPAIASPARGDGMFSTPKPVLDVAISAVAAAESVAAAFRSSGKKPSTDEVLDAIELEIKNQQERQRKERNAKVSR